jgi:DNA-directed RNA polymerase beta' subunit
MLSHSALRRELDDPTLTSVETVDMGIMSARDIRNISVVSITNPKLSPLVNESNHTVYDARMGMILRTRDKCVTCNKCGTICPGHFGHIDLVRPIINPIYIKEIVMYLNMTCEKCHRICVSAMQLDVWCGNTTTMTYSQFVRLAKRMTSVHICTHCSYIQSQYKVQDGMVLVSSRESLRTYLREITTRVHLQITKALHDTHVMSGDVEAHLLSNSLLNGKQAVDEWIYPLKHLLEDFVPADIDPLIESVCVDALYVVKHLMEVHRILKTPIAGMLSELWTHLQKDAQVLFSPPKQYFAAFSIMSIHTLANAMDLSLLYPHARQCVERAHPSSLVMMAIPVMPPHARPFVLTADGKVYHDEITHTYNEIIKYNEQLKTLPNIYSPQADELVENIAMKLRCIICGSDHKAKRFGSGRYHDVHGIRNRLEGKKGLMRENLAGKRVNASARTVVGPDSTLKIDQMAVPNVIADKLLYPQRVNTINSFALTRTWLWKNPKNVIIRRGEIQFRPNSHTQLQPGDTLLRPLQTGDVVLLNRQPTLHAGSMIAMHIVRRPELTFRISLAITTSFNADFDGDEVNIHVPSSEQSRAELEELSTVRALFLSRQNGGPIVKMVQDGVLGMYMLSCHKEDLTRASYQSLMTTLARALPWDVVFERYAHMEHILGKEVYSPYSLLSLSWPSTFEYSYKGVVIREGVLREGCITSSHVGTSTSSLIYHIHQWYGTDEAMRTINAFQFLAFEWLHRTGFSIGIRDCVPSDKADIDEAVSKQLMRAHSVRTSVKDPVIREYKIAQILNCARDVGLKIAKKHIHKDNRFLQVVKSGAKGDMFNITQVTGLCGQQYVRQGRVEKQLTDGTRTLPHYPFVMDDYSLESLESRGFVTSCLLQGRNPQEDWFHSMSARESVLATVVNTMDTGYTQHRMVKVMEEFHVQYDGTVRDVHQNIIQFMYGSTGLDPQKGEVHDGQVCLPNVNAIATLCNAEYERRVY